MKLNYLNKLSFFYLLIFIIFVDFFVLFGVIFYDIFFNSNYISIYSILRIIYKIHFIGIPTNIGAILIEYFLKKKQNTSNVEKQKTSKLTKIIYTLAFLAFIAVTIVCLLIGYPPTPDELMYD